MEEIATVKEKKQALESCVKSLQVDIEKYSIEAEEKKDFNILAKANSFRTTAKTKQETLHDLEKVLVKLDAELKTI